MERDRGKRDPQVLDTRHVNQRSFGYDCRRSGDLRDEQKGECARSANEIGADQAHHRFAGNAKRQRHAGLHGCDPETDLADLPGDGEMIAVAQIASDHRAENRLEARFELGWQAGHLLGRPIDAYGFGRGELAENRDVDFANAPFDCVGGGKRHVRPGQSGDPSGMRSPCDRPAVSSH